jgi:hypothetical protein
MKRPEANTASASQLAADYSASPPEFTEENCPGHIASANDAKVCARCAVHIDSFRPDDDDMEIEQ